TKKDRLHGLVSPYSAERPHRRRGTRGPLLRPADQEIVFYVGHMGRTNPSNSYFAPLFLARREKGRYTQALLRRREDPHCPSLRRLLVRTGQGELKNGTVRFVRLCPQPAPMGVDDRQSTAPSPRRWTSWCKMHRRRALGATDRCRARNRALPRGRFCGLSPYRQGLLPSVRVFIDHLAAEFPKAVLL